MREKVALAERIAITVRYSGYAIRATFVHIMSGAYDDSIWESMSGSRRVADPAVAKLAGEFSAGVRSILDLGCGDGLYLPVLAAGGADVTGADRSQVALDRAALRAPDAGLILVGDDSRLSIEDGVIERVWCSDTIEHVVDTQILLSEVRRVLTPGGRLLVITPDHSRSLRVRLAVSGWERQFDPFSPHLRFYTRKSLAWALTECGLERPQITRGRGQLIAETARS